MQLLPRPTTLLLIALVLIALVFGHGTVRAQSMTVFTTGGDARACSQSAELAGLAPASRRDLDACNRALDEAQLSSRDRAATFVNRGILHAAVAQYQDALNDYNSALAIQPELPQAYVGKGNLYYLADRYDDAIDAYNTALELQLVERHVAYYNLGLVYQKLGDKELAVQYYQRALELVPDWALAREQLQRLAEPQ